MASNGNKRDASTSSQAPAGRAPRCSRWGPPVPPPIPQAAASNYQPAGFSQIPAQRQQRLGSRWDSSPPTGTGSFDNALTAAGAGALTQDQQVMVAATGQMVAAFVQPVMQMMGQFAQKLDERFALQDQKFMQGLNAMSKGIKQVAEKIPGQVSEAVQEKR
jgi:hypothetical protein